MKRIIFYVLMIVGPALFAQSKKELTAQLAVLKSQNEQLTAQINELKKIGEADISNENKKASYGLGVLMAANVKSQGADSLDFESLTFGMRDVLQNKPLKLNQQECMPIVQTYMQAAFAKRTAKVRGEGEAFLQKNKTAEGVVSTASGLQYKVITKGTGKMPITSDNVTVHYAGTLIDGTPFDSSIGKQPATFRVTGVIAGWTEVLQLMHEGDKFKVFIPQELGYGERGSGAIPPYATLVFEVELIKVN